MIKNVGQCVTSKASWVNQRLFTKPRWFDRDHIVVTIMHLQLEYVLFLSLFFLLYTKRIENLSFSMS